MIATIVSSQPNAVRLGRVLSGFGDNESRAMRRTATWMSQLGSSSGFTLIELLLVITILGVLSSVVVFAIGGSPGAASSVACRSDLRLVTKAQEVHFAQTGSYAGSADDLVQARLLRSVPSSENYAITTDNSGAVTATPDCGTLDSSDTAATLPSAPPSSALAASCTAAVDSVTAAQSSYQGTIGSYASSVAVLVKKGYLDADPSVAGYKIKTATTGVVTAAPDCANISDVACNAAVSEVGAAQEARFAQIGKYASSVAALVTVGVLSADPSTDAYKIKTTSKGTVASTPNCLTLA